VGSTHTLKSKALREPCQGKYRTELEEGVEVRVERADGWERPAAKLLKGTYPYTKPPLTSCSDKEYKAHIRWPNGQRDPAPRRVCGTKASHESTRSNTGIGGPNDRRTASTQAAAIARRGIKRPAPAACRAAKVSRVRERVVELPGLVQCALDRKEADRLNCRTCTKRRRIRGKSAPVCCICNEDVWGPDPRDWYGRLVGSGFEPVDTEVGEHDFLPASSSQDSYSPVEWTAPPRAPQGWNERVQLRQLQESDDQREARQLNGS